ncbi:hypothetical protein D3C87_1498540 [compost metagenome]
MRLLSGTTLTSNVMPRVANCLFRRITASALALAFFSAWRLSFSSSVRNSQPGQPCRTRGPESSSNNQLAPRSRLAAPTGRGALDNSLAIRWVTSPSRIASVVSVGGSSSTC